MKTHLFHALQQHIVRHVAGIDLRLVPRRIQLSDSLRLHCKRLPMAAVALSIGGRIDANAASDAMGVQADGIRPLRGDRY